MTTHVFIVDPVTLKFHLEYLFAGTGAKDYAVDFNNSEHTALGSQREHLLVSMIADASRIREGDRIIFYLQQSYRDHIYEGKFYGLFKAVNNWSFLDNNDDGQFLKDELGKSLTFRTLIEPDKIYSKGVTEWEALDEIKNIQSPNQMLWSLIYRKLKGNRGNTMITIYESERLCQLIRNKNDKRELECDNIQLSFDVATQQIILNNNDANQYVGRQEEINVLPRLINKFVQGKAFEPHLQAYIVKLIGRNINRSLDNIIIGDSTIEWIGNEVSCGVGMQRIDLMLSFVDNNSQRVLIPVELKAVEANVNNTSQIQRYIDWIVQYYLPNRQSDIQPMLISKKFSDRNSTKYNDFLVGLREFNKCNGGICNNLKYVEFDVINHNLVFEQIQY